MKVLFITPYTGSAYGGISKVVLELVAALGHSGLQVDLITTNADVSSKLKVPLNRWIQEEGYRIRYFPCWHKNDFIFSHKLLLWLHSHISDYNLVHTHTVFAPLITCCHWICRAKRVPYVVTPHGMLEPWAMNYKSNKKRAYFKFLEIPNLLKSAFVQGISSVEVENLVKLLPNQKVVFVPNGLNNVDSSLSDAYEDSLGSKYPYLKNKIIILFLGRIDPKKGLDLLAPAFAEAHNKFLDTHLVVAGPDNIGFKPKAVKYFVDSGITDSVTFTGMLKGDLKKSALKMAHIYIAPSYSEGFSMSILEGMAAGLPCIITTGCNFPEAMTARAAMVVPPDKEALATALIACLSAPEDASRMGQRAQSYITENYTWQRISEKLMIEYLAVTRDELSQDILASISYDT